MIYKERPNLQSVFYRLELVESYGTGIRKLKRHPGTAEERIPSSQHSKETRKYRNFCKNLHFCKNQFNDFSAYLYQFLKETEVQVARK